MAGPDPDEVPVHLQLAHGLRQLADAAELRHLVPLLGDVLQAHLSTVDPTEKERERERTGTVISRHMVKSVSVYGTLFGLAPGSLQVLLKCSGQVKNLSEKWAP